MFERPQDGPDSHRRQLTTRVLANSGPQDCARGRWPRRREARHVVLEMTLKGDSYRSNPNDAFRARFDRPDTLVTQ